MAGTKADRQGDRRAGHGGRPWTTERNDIPHISVHLKRRKQPEGAE